MSNIWLTSDLHFCHNKDFVWGARFFNNIDEMNEAIVERFNSKVKPEDTLYILGDVMLNDNEKAETYLSRLNGKKIFICGNHDTKPRIEIYKKYTDVDIKYADVIKYKKRIIYLSHYPTITKDDKDLRNMIINFYGHTHQTENFYKDYINMYHVGVDSHNCYPVNIDEALTEITNKILEQKENTAYEK